MSYYGGFDWDSAWDDLRRRWKGSSDPERILFLLIIGICLCSCPTVLLVFILLEGNSLAYALTRPEIRDTLLLLGLPGLLMLLAAVAISRKRRIPTDPDLRERQSESLALRQEGLLVSQPDLARELGVRSPTIHRWCRMLNLKPSSYHAGRNHYTVDQAELIRKYGHSKSDERQNILREILGDDLYEAREEERKKRQEERKKWRITRERMKRFPFSILPRLIIGLLLGSIILAIYFAVTIPAKRSQEANAALERASHWPVFFSDDFSSNVNDWRTGEFSDRLSKGRRIISDGKYRWETEAYEGHASWAYPIIEPVSDFYLRVDARLASFDGGSWESYFGVVFRLVDDENFYMFTHSERVEHDAWGYYGFDLWKEDDWISLRSGSTDYSESYFPGGPHIRHQPDGTVPLTVIAEGSRFFFFVDDEFYFSFEDSQLTSGIVGLAVWLPSEGEEAVIEFDNFEVRVP